MISFIYSVFIRIYTIGYRLLALFHNKADKRIKGLNHQRTALKKNLELLSEKRILLHCASLGEFEQVRPLIKWVMDKTDLDMVVSFYSPSGYENFELDNDRLIKCYLPFDNKSDQAAFIDIIRPQKVIITKNEWWWNLLQVINQRKIESYLVSSTIRSDHYFIKNPFLFFKNRISAYTTIFVVNELSKKRLESIFDRKIIVAGDTRRESVKSIKNKTSVTSLSNTIIYGSIWQSDLHIVKEIIKLLPNYNHLIYPHDLSSKNIEKLASELSCTISTHIPKDLTKKTIIINSMGQLKSDYAKASLAYVGGGFGDGIHNILEASIYEIPVIIGPRWQKDEEARKLIQIGGAFPVNDIEQTAAVINQLKSQKLRNEINLKLKSYFSASQSATELICKEIFQ